MSKLFTATVVMQAVATGRLDLDRPITTYLPGFTVHSAFEKHPERKITLRMLTGHTAGFTQEAPVGNTSELDPGTFEAHVRGISRTWLRFPVGTGLAYYRAWASTSPRTSSSESWEAVPGGRARVAVRAARHGAQHLRPGGDPGKRESRRRAQGRGVPSLAAAHREPMTGAGGLYTSARDLAQFLRFQLNGGSVDGRVVLDRRWLDEMRTVPPPRAGAAAGYALGVVRHRWNTWLISLSTAAVGTGSSPTCGGRPSRDRDRRPHELS